LKDEPETRRQPVEATNSDGRDGLRVTYVPREDATPEGELAALAAVYAFVIQAYQQKKAPLLRTRDERRELRGAAAGPTSVNLLLERG
jgi:hypothetical protein